MVSEVWSHLDQDTLIEQSVRGTLIKQSVRLTYSNRVVNVSIQSSVASYEVVNKDFICDTSTVIMENSYS